ncbi:nuclear receptor-binding factor 2 isoform X2 [Spodoptera frugiperda]|uniref:Nuclear receptor-binding factor 2 isoform X2 n=1 Tax=Spodoptera frugiperda TaxID=7108 RepID=A0A9R0EDR6_SPOFR|nr:nuclear receptor-binding factor 2 isoform X2 [Spodoptera frugiperda]
MDLHPLNLAHQQHRRAEAHLINNRYDEAMQCHHNAAELLLDAMKSTTSSVALESITLQHSYHLKQKDLIKSKKEQYERVKKAMDHIKEQLVLQAEVLKDENMTLKERVSYLEKERVKYLNLPTQSDLLQRNFSNISGNEGLTNEFIQKMPIAKEPQHRPVVQPHFDLSALKDL